MTADTAVRRRTRRFRFGVGIAVGVAAAQLVTIGVLVVRVPRALPVPVVLEIASASVNAHSDPRRVVLQDQNAVRVLDPAAERVITTIDTGAPPLYDGVAVRPGTDEAFVLSGSAVVRVDLAAGSVVGSTPWDPYMISSAVVLGVDDGQHLLFRTVDPGVSALDVASGETSQVSSLPAVVSSRGRLWGADHAALSGEPGCRGRTYGMALSPGEESLYAFTDEPAVCVLDTRTDEVEAVAVDRPIRSGVVLPTADGRHVVTIGGPDSTQVLVRRLDGTDVAAVAAGARIEGMDIAPDGATVYATTGDRLLIIDTRAYT